MDNMNGSVGGVHLHALALHTLIGQTTKLAKIVKQGHTDHQTQPARNAQQHNALQAHTEQNAMQGRYQTQSVLLVRTHQKVLLDGQIGAILLAIQDTSTTKAGVYSALYVLQAHKAPRVLPHQTQSALYALMHQ